MSKAPRLSKPHSKKALFRAAVNASRAAEHHRAATEHACGLLTVAIRKLAEAEKKDPAVVYAEIKEIFENGREEGPSPAGPGDPQIPAEG